MQPTVTEGFPDTPGSTVIACIARAGGSAAFARRVRAATGMEAEVSTLDDLRLPPGFDFLVIASGTLPSAARAEQVLRPLAPGTAVLAAAGDAREELALLAVAARLEPEIHLEVCRDADLETQAGPRLAVLAARRAALQTRDSLTGLGNRQAMRSHVARVLAALPPAGTAAAFILDFDNFKRINEEFGHQVADQVLAQVGALVRELDGFENCVSRIGGDEFGGVLACRDKAEVADLLEALRRAVAEAPLKAGDGRVRLTASIGFAFLEEGLSAEDAYLRADAALYSAKSLGRNRVVCHDLFWDSAAEDPNQAALAHFENVTRVWTQRMSELITAVGRRAIEESRRSAERDGLTDLFNRRYFDRRIVREMESARRTGAPLSLVLLDVDDFHGVNMTHGYPTGDRALKEVADLARNHSRTTDWVARYGGEEFCVVMPGATPAEARVAAERLRAALEAATIKGYAERRLKLTASLGVASLADTPEGCTEGAALVQAASDRVVAAKQAGKNRVSAPAP